LTRGLIGLLSLQDIGGNPRTAGQGPETKKGELGRGCVESEVKRDPFLLLQVPPPVEPGRGGERAVAKKRERRRLKEEKGKRAYSSAKRSRWSEKKNVDKRGVRSKDRQKRCVKGENGDPFHFFPKFARGDGRVWEGKSPSHVGGGDPLPLKPHWAREKTGGGKRVKRFRHQKHEFKKTEPVHLPRKTVEPTWEEGGGGMVASRNRGRSEKRR